MRGARARCVVFGLEGRLLTMRQCGELLKALRSLYAALVAAVAGLQA
jgi:hypothetical protein